MQPVRIIQLTDTHLKTPAGPLRGMEISTEESLIHVLQSVDAAEKDLLICTGDLSDTPDARTYQRLVELLTPLDVPVYCLAGNHDDPVMGSETCAGTGLSWQKVIELGDWVVIMLESFLHDETHGELGVEELGFLQTALGDYPDRHVLLCLHHHPIKTGSEWMDDIMLLDGDRLFEIIEQFQHVRGMIWGHIHQEFDEMRGDVRCLGTPSTCRQFKPDETVFIVDDNHPGYRELTLHADGRIDTRVQRCP